MKLNTMKKTMNLFAIVAILFATMTTSCKNADEIRNREAAKAGKVKKYVPVVAPSNLGVIHKSTNEEFQKAIDNKVGVLVDIRTPEEFAEGHLPGSVNVNFKKRTFKSFISKFDKNTPVLIYCRSGNRSGKAEKAMRALGFKEVYDLKGGFKGWKAANMPIAMEDNDANKKLQEELAATPPKVEPLASLGATEDIDAAAFKKLVDEGKVTVVDVRTEKEYLEGFIPGAVNVDWKNRHFPENVVKNISNDKPVAIYCRSGNRSSKAETVMQSLGFTKVYNLATGWKGWNAAKFPVATLEVKGDIRHLDVKNFNNAIQGKVGVLVDVRTPKEYADYHIPGAINVDVKNGAFSKMAAEKLKKDTPVLVYCRSGVRSMKALKTLEKMGYKVYNLNKGMLQWKKDNMPVEGKNVKAHDSGEEGC